jgi:putative heme transporter
MPRLGVWSWGFVGIVTAAIIIVVALAAVSEIVLPMTFAAVLAVIFKPLAGTLQRHRWKPSLAAGVILLCLLAVVGVVVVATVRGVIQQADQISAVTDKALNNAADLLDAAGIDKAALDDARAATEGAAPMIADGFLTKVISGIGSLIGLVSGIILGALIMYYLLKDGTSLRRSLIARIRDPSLRGDVDDFISDTCQILREYGRAQTIMATIVAVVIGLAALLLGLPLVFTIIVVNFVGGYIPYIGAFLGGGLAVIVALGDGGLPKAAVILIVVLAANLMLENFIQPKVMSRTLAIPPAGRPHRHRLGRPPRRHGRPHPGRARLRDRLRRDLPVPIERPRREGRRPRPTDRSTPARLRCRCRIRGSWPATCPAVRPGPCISSEKRPRT